ncbi:MAG: hypothetical protein WCC87_10365 [Candidatus Korobacteraceae bacterium]
MQALELAGDRRIAIKDRGRLFRFTLAPIGREMWLKYFDSIVSTSENRGREQHNTFDTTSPLLAMVGEAITDASGYKLPEGAAKLADVADWKAKLPFSHRAAVGSVLTNVGAMADDGGEEGVIGLDTVSLEALWSCDDNGVMFLHRPLVHRFTTPSFEHERRYMRDQSRSKVIGGSRTGKTVWTGVQRTLVEIYDELVVSVSGYALNSSPLGPGQITQYMDTYHKVVAAQQLFRAPAQVEPAEESEAVA